ncbi:MAG: hypothetical protein JSS22_09100 [Proteobacteria bacterium]|nr:hypothetical protein [Pseudomonadota bacterium]
MESQIFIRSATASFAGHMVLAASLFLAEAHPFDYVPQESIAVDLVTPAEVPTAKETPPESQKSPPTPVFQIPDDKPVADSKPAADTKPAAADVQQQPAPPSASSSPAQSSVAAPVASKQAALQPSLQPQPAPSYTAPEPDISVKYGVLLGLPAVGAGDAGDAGGAAEATKADIPSMDTAEFRRHLKTCSKMPTAVAPGDNIRIVLRVPFTTDGKIAAPPALIEASASAKGPALMKGAVEALVACQPYAMLPAAKYDEWKVLDLSFTPRDFVGG